MSYAGIKYDELPEHMRGAAQRYVEHGIRPGDFLQAVICNNLVEAFGRADDDNRTAMFQWAGWLYNEVPAPAWGSEAKMRAWSEQGGMNGHDVALAPEPVAE